MKGMSDGRFEMMARRLLVRAGTTHAGSDIILNTEVTEPRTTSVWPIHILTMDIADD